ncbi:glutathione S-transferase 1-1-like [Culicoides brevitarsis]|uniref:glutathione S-transferase 1-1-like n=1 Tax=Culicoides brevitarsis TaxID=469753 RepID=UPI00307BE3FA
MAPVLYYMPEGPPSRAVVMCIRYLELRDIELKLCRTYMGETSEPDFIKMNPQKTVPFLDDNGFYLAESRAIMLYLVHSRAPESVLLGRFPKKRAMIQHRLDFELGTIAPIAGKIIRDVMMGDMTVIPPELKEKLYKALEITNSWLTKTAYIADNFISIADFSYLATISTFFHCGVPIEEKFPNIWAWYQRSKSLAGYEENEEGARTLGHMFKQKLAEPF